MKRIGSRVGFGLVLTAMAAGLVGCASAKPASVRVLCYNIHHGAGMDEKLDLERIADVIRRTEADLVALQEVDRGVARTNRVDQPAELAKLTGMHAVFERNIVYQGGDYGNAILSRYPVESHKNHFLPQSRPDEQRGLLEVRVRVAGRPLVFCATHLSYHGDDQERMDSVELLKAMMAGWEGLPVIVAGDFNALPDSRVLKAATAFMHDAHIADATEGLTFPADEPVRRIDYILHNSVGDLKPIESRVIAEPVASDHRPLLAVFELAGNGG